MKTLIKNVNYADKQIDILIEDKIIVELGTINTTADNIIDSTGLYIHSGLVNAYFNGDIDDAKRLASQGVVAVFDYSNNEEVTNYLVNSGIKVYKAIGDFYGDLVLSEDYLLNQITKYKTMGVKDIILYVPNPNIADEMMYTEIIMAAKKYGYIISTSVSENLEDVGEIDKEYNMSPVELLESYGFLDFKNILIDCVYLDKDDVNILTNYDTTICTCPTKNLKSGSGIAPVYSFIKNNLNVVVGGNVNDIISELNLTKNLQSGHLNEANIVSDNDVKLMSNYNAKQLFNSIGSLKINDFADIILTDEEDIFKCTPLNIKYNFTNGVITYKNI